MQIPFVSYEHCEAMFQDSLGTTVDPHELFNESPVTKHCPFSNFCGENLVLLTLEQWVLQFSSLSRIQFPKAVRSFRRAKFVRSSVESSGP